jgi:GTP-binding protein HflX
VIALGKERIRERIAQLEAELEMVRRTFRARKKQRKEEVYLVALVGYTNAGKSSLMRGMSGSEVLVEDKLFATLGTTARQLEPPASPPVVLSDTVGFIQDLPHELVASFRSTLEEAADADLILLVLDASDPNWREHLEVTRETLGTIDVDERRVRIVFNKCDALEERVARADPRCASARAVRGAYAFALHAR